MKININNIKFVKATQHRVNPFKSTLEKIDANYVVNTRVEGVAIIPYRHGTNGKEILIRDEYTPLRQTVLSLVRGRKDPEDGDGLEWWRSTARRELLEEAGILAEERWFSYVGELLPQANYKNTDILVIVDVTGMHQGRPITDGSIWEKKSTNFWVSIYDVLRMIKEPHQMDNYLLSALTLFLNWCGLINPMGKSEESDLEKAKKGEQKPGHKYIRREGPPGQYKYIYKEPEAKGSKKPDEKKGKGGIMEQLVTLLGKKQGGGEGEKKPKKQLPFDEFSAVPKDMPDFDKGISAIQWMAKIERTSATKNPYDFDDADHDIMSDPSNQNRFYADGLIEMLRTTPVRFINDFRVDNAKLKDDAQKAVKGAIGLMSESLAKVKSLTRAMDSSIAEKVFDNFTSKMSTGKFDHAKLDKAIRVIASLRAELEEIGKLVSDVKWLQGSDPKLDFLVDQIFESIDELMRSRNRFVKNGFRFYVDNLTPLVESLKDAEEITHAAAMLENLNFFIDEAMRTSVTSRNFESFANQWNLKQRGMYDAASRFSSYVSSKIVDKVRSLESLGDDNIVRNHVKNLANRIAFTFLSMNETRISGSINALAITEQIFSYIDLHGVDKYYQDMVFLTGGRPDVKDHYKDVVATLTKAYNGEDVYWDDDVLYQSESSRGIGDIRPDKFGAVYSAMNILILLNNNAPISSKTPAFIRMWSQASHGSLMSNMIEQFVSSKKIDRGTYVNYHIASNRVINPKRASTKDALSKTIGQIYNETQENLKNTYRSPEGTKPVRLYRGNGDSEIKSAASSWTTKDDIAVQFGSKVVTAEVPAKAILLAYHEDDRDFWNYPHEKEHLIIPGLLTADDKINPEPIADSERQSILDRQLDKEANAYSEEYQ